MEEYLSKQFSQRINKPNVSMEDEISNICENFYNKPVHNLQDLKHRNTKLKGDIFEAFCYMYMKICYGLQDVWDMNTIPIDIRTQLNLGKRDMGTIQLMSVCSKSSAKHLGLSEKAVQLMCRSDSPLAKYYPDPESLKLEGLLSKYTWQKHITNMIPVIPSHMLQKYL